MRRLVGILGAVTILPLLFAANSANAAVPVIRQQAPCDSGGGVCVDFGNATVMPPTVRTYSFSAPGTGTVAVTLNGTMVCENTETATNGAIRVIDLRTQIVEGTTTAANPVGPGGARYLMRIPSNTSGIPLSDVTNLAITRVFNVTAGTHAYSYNVVRNRMDLSTDCTMFNVYFTVVFVPK